MTALRSFETPREADLGLRRIANLSGLSISVLPNGCVFAIEHQHERGQTLDQPGPWLAAPRRDRAASICGSTRRSRTVVEAVGPGAKVGFGAADDRFTWEGAAAGVRHEVSLWLHPRHRLWLWRVQVANVGAQTR